MRRTWHRTHTLQAKLHNTKKRFVVYTPTTQGDGVHVLRCKHSWISIARANGGDARTSNPVFSYDDGDDDDDDVPSNGACLFQLVLMLLLLVLASSSLPVFLFVTTSDAAGQLRSKRSLRSFPLPFLLLDCRIRNLPFHPCRRIHCCYLRRFCSCYFLYHLGVLQHRS